MSPAEEDDIASALYHLERLGILDACDRIACEHGQKLEHVLGRSHRPTIARARHHLWAVIRWSTGLSYPELAEIFHRNHTTIIDGVRVWHRELNSSGSSANGTGV